MFVRINVTSSIDWRHFELKSFRKKVANLDICAWRGFVLGFTGVTGVLGVCGFDRGSDASLQQFLALGRLLVLGSFTRCFEGHGCVARLW